MSANVHYLYPRQAEIGHFLRLGHTGYRNLENLLAAGRLPIKRAVIDASHQEKQADLISSLKSIGTELVLDPKTAELSLPGGFATRARNLPWAHNERPHLPSDFTKNRLKYCEQLAEFSVSLQVDVVHSATHVITSSNSPWLSVDVATCAALRQALDRSGGQRIQIDYPLIIPYQVLRDERACDKIIEVLRGLPYTNLWLRVSGSGMSATPAGLSRYIHGAWRFQKLNKPIIADGVGGLVGLSIAAFGAAGGICHGIAEKENFNSNNWERTRENSGGAKRRIYIPDIDLYLYADQAQALLHGRGAKSLLACNDTSCCANGLVDMINQHKAHALIQSARLISSLNEIPEAKWVDHLLDKHIAPAGRTAHKVERIKLSDVKLMEKLAKRSRQLDSMYQVLEALYQSSQEIPKSVKPNKRHITFPSLGKTG